MESAFEIDWNYRSLSRWNQCSLSVGIGVRIRWNTQDGGVNRAANQKDVEDVHFVMLIDGDPDKAVHPEVDPNQVGSNTGTGSYEVPRVDSGAVSVNGRYSYYTLYSSTVENFAYYEAAYQLQFPLFDPSGKPYITKSTKSIVVKVIYPTGEHTAEFDLDKLPSP